MSAYEIQTQQLQTILNKRANDSRAAGQATNEVVAQVSISPLCCLCSHQSYSFCLFYQIANKLLSCSGYTLNTGALLALMHALETLIVASLANMCALLLHVPSTDDECCTCQLQGCSTVFAALEHQNSVFKTAMQAQQGLAMPSATMFDFDTWGLTVTLVCS